MKVGIQPLMAPHRRNGVMKQEFESVMSAAPPGDAVSLRFAGVLDAPDNPLLNPALHPEQFRNAVFKLMLDAINHPAKRVEATARLCEVLDLYLQGQWTDESQPRKRDMVLNSLRKLTGAHGDGDIAIAQIDSTPGDLEGNARKIMAYMDAAERIGVDTIVFPEMALMGYPIRDIIGRHPFIVEENMKWLEAIARRSGKTKVIVGFVEPRLAGPWTHPTGKQYFNSVAVLANGKFEGVVRKSLLPTYGEFNEDRHFMSSPASGVQSPKSLAQAAWGGKGAEVRMQHGRPADIHGNKVGITICEDIWNDDDYFDRNLYARDPYAEVAARQPAYMINCSASPSRARKEQNKNNMLTHMASKYGIPLVYVNRVGAVDEHSFDGASRVYDGQGKLIARARSFSEQFMIVNPLKSKGTVYPLPPGLEEANQFVAGRERAAKDFDPNDTSDLGRTYETIIQGIRGYFRKNGFEKAVLGLSGGLDSSVVAVLLADALGPENVLGVSMPAKITRKTSRDDARDLAANLGIQFRETRIAAMVGWANRALSLLFNVMPQGWGEQIKESTTYANLQARMRAIVLWSASNEYSKVLPIATSDKSELYMGYATVNGDMSGGFAPIADVTKTKLFALARWMNRNRPVKDAIPQAILDKKPGAELEIDKETGEPLVAEKALMPYEFMDEVIWRIENKGESYQQMLEQPFWYEKQYPLRLETKQEWLDKFFRKMSAAVFKWTLLPPGVIVDGQSIMKAEYQIPITARVRWQGHDKAQIDAILDPIRRPPGKTA